MIHQICFVVQSPDTEAKQVEEWCAALAIQAARDICPSWGLVAPTFMAVSNTKDVPRGANAIHILRMADVDDALGYHTVDERGRPVGYVFTDGLAAAEIPPVMSHEAGEMMVDPYVQEWMYSDKLEVHFAKEIHDPVESLSYQINGVAVSNFVIPAYFSDWTPPSANVDFLHSLKGPWSVNANDGYVVAMKDGQTMQLPPEAKMDIRRQHPLARIQRRLAAAPRPARQVVA